MKGKVINGELVISKTDILNDIEWNLESLLEYMLEDDAIRKNSMGYIERAFVGFEMIKEILEADEALKQG